MGRRLDDRNSDIEVHGYLPGWMRNMFHWHNTKKMSPRRKDRGGKHAKCFGNPKTVSFEHYNDEVQAYLDADAVPLLDEQQITKATPADKISGKARIEALVTKEMSARSQLQQLNSLHHLGHTDGLGGISAEWSNPIIILQKNADAPASELPAPSLPKSPQERLTHDEKYHLHHTMDNEAYLKQKAFSAKQEFSSGNGDNDKSMNQNLSDAKQLDRQNSYRQFMECVDVLELFKINKELFLDILQDPDVQAVKNFNVQVNSEVKARLKKSGSFPIAQSPHNRILRPSTLERKQKEIWSFSKREKFPAGVKAPKSVSSESLEVSQYKSMVLKADDSDKVVAATVQKTDFSSSSLSQGPNKHGWHQSLMTHLKCAMKKIKHSLKESKKENNHMSNALIHKVPSGSELPIDEKQTPVRLKEAAIHQDGKENPESFYDNDLSKGQLPHMRRISSLNASLDRYTRLFEYTLIREAKGHTYQSKSLKLTNEDRIPPTGHGFKSFRRRLSLPDHLESFYPLTNETSHDELQSEVAVKTVKDNITNVENDSGIELKSASSCTSRRQFEAPDNIEEIELEKNIGEGGNRCEYNEVTCDPTVDTEEEIAKSEEQHGGIVEPEKEGYSACQDQEIGSMVNSSREDEKQTPSMVLETDFQDDIPDQAEFPVSKNSELDKSICVEEPTSSINLQEKSSEADSKTDKIAQIIVRDHIAQFESNEQDNPDFHYVKDVLEVSGLIEQGYLGTWHSLDQPLSPTLFKELEAYLHQELAFSSEDVGYNCDHLLLFYMINEMLLQMYESSLAYFPKTFSFARRARPLPKGNHVLEEVWKRISWYRSPRLKMNQSLDDIVAGDLAKDDSWLNIQFDVEDIALDLEEMIFDGLLDEAMQS